MTYLKIEIRGLGRVPDDLLCMIGSCSRCGQCLLVGKKKNFSTDFESITCHQCRATVYRTRNIAAARQEA